MGHRMPPVSCGLSSSRELVVVRRCPSVKNLSILFFAECMACVSIHGGVGFMKGTQGKESMVLRPRWNHGTPHNCVFCVF
jgi:hypothetical protein